MNTLKRATKFTFKINAPTGRYRSFDKTSVDIKFNKIEVGLIQEVFLKEWKIMFKVKDENKNCGWKWATLLFKAISINEAKEYVNNNFQKIQNLKLYISE